MADDFLSFFAGCYWQKPSVFYHHSRCSATIEHFYCFFNFVREKMGYVNCLL